MRAAESISLRKCQWNVVDSNSGKERYPKELLRQGFAELSGELSGAICLKTLVLPQKECGKRSSITFFVFGTLSVTFR